MELDLGRRSTARIASSPEKASTSELYCTC